MKRATLQAAARPLLGLTAADLMTAPVMTIPEEMSLSEAARLLSGAHVSGAPVVDAEGRCVGVLSSSDFVTFSGDGRRRAILSTSVFAWIGVNAPKPGSSVKSTFSASAPTLPAVSSSRSTFR